jgi:hypothetical protein
MVPDYKSIIYEYPWFAACWDCFNSSAWALIVQGESLLLHGCSAKCNRWAADAAAIEAKINRFILHLRWQTNEACTRLYMVLASFLIACPEPVNQRPLSSFS